MLQDGHVSIHFTYKKKRLEFILTGPQTVTNVLIRCSGIFKKGY